jgi:hypothetical protein
MTSTLFINSLPKSGTHLLAKCVDVMGHRHYPKRFIASDWVTSGSITKTAVKRIIAGSLLSRNYVNVGMDVSAFVSERELTSFISEAANYPNARNYILGHAPYSDLLSRLLVDHNIRTLFIIRDPRDVLVSWAHYIYNQPRHFAYSGFAGKSLEERFRLVLDGGYLPNGIFIESYANIIRSTFGWISNPSVLTVYFEDLVGQLGGGNDEAQARTIKQIAEFAGIDNVSVSDVSSQLFGGTKTFRDGQIGGWRGVLSPEFLELFNIRVGFSLPILGYSD